MQGNSYERVLVFEYGGMIIILSDLYFKLLYLY